MQKVLITIVMALTLLTYSPLSVDSQKIPYLLINYGPECIEQKLEPKHKVVADYILSENPDVTEKKAKKIVKAINTASTKYKIAPEILVGLMSVESQFDSESVSSKGAVGLMQVHPKTWLRKNEEGVDLKSMGICRSLTDLYNEDTNVVAGAYILRYYLDKAEKVKAKNPYKYALTRYYGGSNNYHYYRTMNSVNKFKKYAKGTKNV